MIRRKLLEKKHLTENQKKAIHAFDLSVNDREILNELNRILEEFELTTAIFKLIKYQSA